MRRSLVLLATAGLATAAVAWHQTVNQLQQDGRTISTNLKVVDGTLMMPVKDLASYLGGDLSIANGTATISGRAPVSNPGSSIESPVQAAASGGFPGMGAFTSAAQQFAPAEVPKPRELTAHVGEAVESDGFRFTLLGIDEVDKGDYRTRFDPRHRKIGPATRDERLVVARMRVENASDQTQRASLPVARDLTLFDDRGVGLPALAFDARPIDPTPFDYGDDPTFASSVESPLLAPQGAFEFAAVFSVPKDRSAKSLAASIPPATTGSGGANVRFSL